ncbi:phage major capsid protein [Streptomyces sp. S3(2020)]|uniref:phage major capsid protein n=1 Tax=Streptomyces sp. S3(2020) TaxID=2732044 RepID=UPI001487FCAF|nr:phage major capsid protein [Streptomyces sp. S3(2020)]NNN34379.1 phage major capsid protein [Streptomyces sp. S3(2020)]
MQHLPTPVVAPVGHRRDGRPIYPIKGGAETLEQRRDRITRQLEDPNFSGDVQALLDEAAEVRQMIERDARLNRLRELGASDDVRSVPAGAAAEDFRSAPEFEAYRRGGYAGKVKVEVRATITTGTNGVATIERPAGVKQVQPDYPLTVAALFASASMSGSVIEQVVDLGTGTLAAAEVAEGAVKPESSINLDTVSVTPKTVAHWVKISRQAADDNAQLTGYINNRLMYGLAKRLDQQLMSGNGTGANLRGLLNTTGLSTYTPATGETLAKEVAIRKAITVAQIAGFAPTGLVIHPTDWADVELSETTDEAFRVNTNIQSAMSPQLWGVPAVVTTAVPAGTFLIGDFVQAATLYTRQAATILMTDSDGDDFISNILTILAETRVALAVDVPKAVVKGAYVPAA